MDGQTSYSLNITPLSKMSCPFVENIYNTLLITCNSCMSNQNTRRTRQLIETMISKSNHINYFFILNIIPIWNSVTVYGRGHSRSRKIHQNNDVFSSSYKRLIFLYTDLYFLENRALTLRWNFGSMDNSLSLSLSLSLSHLQ